MIRNFKYFYKIKLNLFRIVNNYLENIKGFTKSMMNQECYPIDFPDILKQKYFLIISNIYYLCVKESCIFFRQVHLDNTTTDNFDPLKLGLFSSIYKKKLKEVRKRIMDEFKISHQYNNLTTKLLLRMLPFYYDITSNFRKKTVLIKKVVDEILNYLENKDYCNETIHEKIDKIINLSDKIDTEVIFIFYLKIFFREKLICLKYSHKKNTMIYIKNIKVI